MGDNYRFKETETTMLSPTTLKFVDTKSFRVVIPGMNEWVGDPWDEINYELPVEESVISKGDIETFLRVL